MVVKPLSTINVPNLAEALQLSWFLVINAARGW
jgi:hypothetical protein